MLSESDVNHHIQKKKFDTQAFLFLDDIKI